jgi:hypothetical protein
MGKTCRYFLLLLGWIAIWPLTILSANVRIEARFEPASITLSNSTSYKIVIHGTQKNPQGAVPQVPGLVLSNNPRTFRSASFINGVPSIKAELSFDVSPQREGTFTMPAWQVSVDGKNYQVPPSTLQVLPPNQADIARQKAQQEKDRDLQEAAFLELTTERPFLFKGETTAANLSLYLWERLPVTKIDQLPQKSGDGFSISELDQPEEKRNVSRGNKIYSVFTWNIGLTGALSGQHTLSFDSTIRVRVKGSKNSPFGNPFFNDPFFGFGREQALEIQSRTYDFEVRDLPTQGRPADFQGAIGSFSASSSIDLDRVSLGDPVRLKFVIQGKGNFSAIPAPAFPESDRFRTGPPAFSFEGNQITKYQGSQSFEYVLTPLTAGLLEVPTMQFSYFDPEQEKYFTATTSPHPLRVDPGEKWVQPPSQTSPEKTDLARISTRDLFQTESEPGTWAPSLSIVHPLQSGLFWTLQAGGVLIFALVLFLKVRRKDPRRDALLRKERVLLGKLSSAVKLKDGSSFYQNLRKILQLRIGMVCEHDNPAALSTHELIGLLEKNHFSGEVCSETENLLRQCDNQEYAASSGSAQALQVHYQQTTALLKKMKRR